MITELILQPLLAGLSVGAFCLTYCFPFMGTYLAAEDRAFKSNLMLILQFLLGRLLGYLSFGFLVGFLGERFDAYWLRVATSVSLVLISILLAFFLLGVLKEKNLFCANVKFSRRKSPVLMGFLMGINLCPPFLLSVAYVFSKHNALYGAVYFALFFVASSVYFLPLAFVGLAAKAKEFRTVARVSGFLVAAIFFVYGIYSLLHN